MQKTHFFIVFLICFLALSLITHTVKPKAPVTYLKTFEQDGTSLKIQQPKIANSIISFIDTKELYQFNITANNLASNIITIPWETSGMEFVYQPPLDEELDVKLYDFVNATHAFSKFENLYRPENIVGSYAVYKTVKGLGTSKLYHIYRPLIIDAKGSQVWANLTVTKSQMQITIDAEWLANAVYPIVIDPSFGKTDAGGSDNVNLTNSIRGTLFNLPEDGTVTHITVYAADSSKNVKVGIYTNVGGSPASGVLKVQGVAAVPEDYGTWIEIDVADTFLSAGDYWLMLNSDGADVKYDGVGSGTYTGYAYADSMPDPHPAIDGTLTREYSIYANYTTGGGPTEISESGNVTLAYSSGYFNNWVFGTVGAQTVTFQSSQQRQVAFLGSGVVNTAFSSGFIKAFLLSWLGSGTIAFTVSSVASFVGLTIYNFYGSVILAFTSGHTTLWLFNRLGGVAVAFTSGIGRAVGMNLLSDATITLIANGFFSYITNALNFYGSAVIAFLTGSGISYTTTGLYLYGSAAITYLVDNTLRGLELLQRIIETEGLASAAFAIAILALAMVSGFVGLFLTKRKQ